MTTTTRLVCDSCDGKFEVEADEEYPILFCPSCGTEIMEEIDHEEENEDN